MKRTKTTTARRTLALLMTVLMLMGAWVFVAPGASATVTTTTNLPTFTFYVPETIYLNPSDNKTFQYYVDRAQAVDGALTASASDTSAWYYFKCDTATKVTSLTCNADNVDLSKTTSTNGELKGLISGGALASAISMNSTALIPWTVTFETADGSYSATAYSVAYAPNRNVTANGATGYNHSSDKAFASSLIYIQGAQTTAEGSWTGESSSEHYTYYQKTSGRPLDPLVAGVGDPENNNPQDYGTADSPFTDATKSSTYCRCVRKDEYSQNDKWIVHIECNRTPAEVIVDTSRYSNTNQLPNLKLGFIVTDRDHSNKRRNAYVADCTSQVSNANNLSSATMNYTGTYGGNSTTVDLLKHSRWREDDFSKGCYSKAGTVLWGTSGCGDDSDTTIGKKYSAAINYAVSGSGATTYRYFRGGACGAVSKSWAMSTVLVILKVTTVDKSSLRSLVNTCVGTYIEQYYTNSTWSTYSNALSNAFRVLGNPAATASDISSATTSLTNAKNALVKNIGTATVTHKSVNGSQLAVETENYNFGDNVTVAANSYTGYDYTDAQPAALTQNNVTTNALSWILRYTPKDYTIGYTLNDGTVASANPTGYTIESADITLNNPTKTGYDFAGWTGMGLSSASTSVTIPTGSTGNRTYTATWTKHKYEVKFYDDSGNQVGNTQLVPYQEDATPPAALTKAPTDDIHYNFDGWSGYTNITADTVITGSFTPEAHDWQVTSSTPATCVAQGSASYACSGCTKTKSETLDIDNTNHTNTQNTPAVAPTCRTPGYTAGVYCRDCNQYVSGHVMLSTVPHSFTNYIPNDDASCTQNATETATCDFAGCNEQDTREIPDTMLPHTYDQQVATDAYKATDATCTAKATYYYSCVCGEKGTETFESGDKLPHTYDQQVATDAYKATDATCTAKATYYYSCVCGEKGTETFESGDKLPHTFDQQVADDAYKATDATCTAKATYYYSCTCGAKGTETFESGDKLPHTYDQQVATDAYKATDATCTAKATYYYSCVCGEKGTETFESGDKLPHTFDQEVADDAYKATDATCTAKATYYYSCTCGEKGTETFESGDKLPHTYDQQVATDAYKATDATCTAKATYYYSCTCGEKGTETFESGDKLPHTFDQQVADDAYKATDATCIAKATYYYSCVCGEKGTETFENGNVDLTNHATTETVLLRAKDPGYTSAGYTGDICCAACQTVLTSGGIIAKLNAAENENVIAANDVLAEADAHPEQYDAEQIGALQTALGELDALLEGDDEAAVLAKLSEIGTLAASITANVDYTVTFKVDGEVVSEQTVPAGGDATAPAQAAYINDGEGHRKFSGWSGDYTNVTANLVITATYDAEAHTWVDGDVTLAPTCSETGTQAQSCACGATNEKTLPTDADNHADYGTATAGAVTATCKTDGYTGDTVCARCGATLVAGETISKDTIPHTPGTPTQEDRVEPTCAVEGSYTEVVKCTVCGAEISRTPKTIPTKPHTLKHLSAIAASCDKEGRIECWQCSECRHYFADAAGTQVVTAEEIVVPRTTHTLTAVEAVEPTCEDGNIAYWYCSGCNKYYSDEAGNTQITPNETVIPALGHSFRSDKTDATCTANGKTTYTCTRCGYSYDETIPAKGHSDANGDGKCDACGQSTNPDVCRFCGKVHTGFFGKIVQFFHHIFWVILHWFD